MTKKKMQGMSVLDLYYTTELHPKVLACLSNTTYGDYFNARSTITFDTADQEDEIHEALLPYADPVRMLFPMYDEFIDQLADSRADPGEAADHFVREVIPYLAQVLLQDACFFTHRFPDHVVSHLFLEMTPPSFLVFTE
jgi:hypothetical protein